MLIQRHRHLLLAAASDAPEAPAAGVAPESSTPAAAAPVVVSPPAKTGIFDRAAALINGANGNAHTIAQLRGDVAARDTTIADLTAQLAARDSTIADLTAQVTAFKAQELTLQAAITALEQKSVSVQTEVIHQLAAAGLPEAQLPKTTTVTTATATSEELWARAEAENDPVLKGKLANQAQAATAAERKRREAAALN